ncbi:DUF916 domain-containing protein [Vagococcus zengguangii]|uniref:DUF916 domain-containing protein n=1 Tax=Vagococcus zengguangii TaxID=2571750 RepID=A0A4D7CP67_9ENTE|nr:DUF916 domain-containing protein [Vagococcus zengguangii]QCI85885.1 DUF916 domain-containing protein [Vagococcus zengguangii]TLG81825.1 DUF916 domain-containing protein [Vagococcus zengguangii]
MKYKHLIGCFILFLVVFFNSMMTYGEEIEGGMPYDVRINVPQSQKEKNLGYFDVIVPPDKEQELSIKVRNISPQKITLILTPYTATTNENGDIDYVGNRHQLSDSIPTKFSDIISKKQTVTLEKDEQKDVVFTLKTPTEKFDGVLLGCIDIHQELKEQLAGEKAVNQQVGIQVKNILSQTIGVVVRNSREDVKEDFGLLDATLVKNDENQTLSFSIENKVSKILKGYSYEAKLYDEKEQLIFTMNKEEFDMAPNSLYRNLEKITSQQLNEESYTLKLKIYNKKKSQQWELSKDIKVKKNQDDRNLSVKISKLMPNNDKNSLILMAASGFAIVLLIAISTVLRKKH